MAISFTLPEYQACTDILYICYQHTIMYHICNIMCAMITICMKIKPVVCVTTTYLLLFIHDLKLRYKPKINPYIYISLFWFQLLSYDFGITRKVGGQCINI